MSVPRVSANDSPSPLLPPSSNYGSEDSGAVTGNSQTLLSLSHGAKEPEPGERDGINLNFDHKQEPPLEIRRS